MAFDPRRAARDIQSDASAGAKWAARTMSSGSTWRRIGRRVEHSFVGSLIRFLISLLSLALLFAGFWLHERLAVPTPLLYGAGFLGICLSIWLNRHLWRRYTRTWASRRRPSPRSATRPRRRW